MDGIFTIGFPYKMIEIDDFHFRIDRFQSFSPKLGYRHNFAKVEHISKMYQFRTVLLGKSILNIFGRYFRK